MTQRERFFEFIKGKKSKEQAIPFPICKTAFIASALGRDWATDVKYAECRDVMLSCGCIPSVIIGEKDWFPEDHNLSLKGSLYASDDNKRRYRAAVETPYGEMVLLTAECKRQSLTVVKGVIQEEEDFDKLIWYLREVGKNVAAIKEKLLKIRKEIGEDCLITLYVPQPYEAFSLINREEAIYFELDYPEKFEELQHNVFETVKSIIPAAIEAGADLLFFGSAGTELYSPELFRKHLLKPSIEYARLIRQAGGISSFHICGKAKEYVDMGVFNEIKVDIIEGLATEPTGNISSLREAYEKLPEEVILRGSIDLGILRNGSLKEVRQRVKEQKDQLEGYKYIVSGACDILYGTPAENVGILAEGCQQV